ncbi:MAG: type II 3-dehydroquinate dehydratase [Pseudomonadota bacterium]|nr:type II 3-dehydroquinate dehydratase [Pseudomonadota bacterium]
MRKIMVIHGPNLNLLGVREPEHYGRTSLESINRKLAEITHVHGVSLETFQSNSESGIVECIQNLMDDPVDFIIINPAAFTHTSIAIRDALVAARIPFIEVHLSNVFSREPFRHHSYFTDKALGLICGLGPHGYELAVAAALHYLES